MPGKEGGKRPGSGSKDQEQRPAYLDVRRYPDQETVARAYMEGQQALKKDGGQADVSLYRLQYGPELSSHVVALGNPPPKPLQEKLEVAFGLGERVTLPPDVIGVLVERRALAAQIAPWVEGHYRPGERRFFFSPDTRRGRKDRP